MLIQEIKTISSGPKELRSFSRVVGSVLVFLGGIAFWHGKAHAIPCLIAGVLLLILGQLFPGILKPVQKCWMALALVMGWIMTRILLGLLFYAIVTPIALIRRGAKSSNFKSRFREAVTTYWIPKIDSKSVPGDYEKQF